MKYYKQYQWNAFSDIIIEEQKKYQNLKKLNYFFNELVCLEREYAEGISRLECCFTNIVEFGSFGDTLKKIFDSMKKKSEFHLNFVERVKSIIKPEKIEHYFNNQKNYHLQYQNEEAKFIEYSKEVDKAKMNYHKCFSESEKIFIEQNKKDLDIGKPNKKAEKFKALEKIAREEYCKAIIVGNEQRNKYENAINDIFDQCEDMDTGIILTAVNYVQSYFSQENEMLTKIIQSNNEIVECSQRVDPQNDMKLFCESNHRHGQPPNKFDFVVYKQDYNYPTLSNKQKTNSAAEYIKQLFKAYGYFPPQGINDVSLNQKYRDVETLAVKSWLDGLNESELKQLMDLFEQRDYRLHFLKCANHFRLELFPMKILAFDTVASLMLRILDKSIENQSKDFEAIKFIIILSQTFYKDNPETNENQYLLQNIIMNHSMWKDCEIWKGLIDFSYELDMFGGASSKKIISHDDLTERINKEQTTMTITLITFKFIMKCFGYNFNSSNEVLKFYCEKYGISQEIIVDNEEQEISELQKEVMIKMNQPQIAKENAQLLIEQANEGDEVKNELLQEFIQENPEIEEINDKNKDNEKEKEKEDNNQEENVEQ